MAADASANPNFTIVMRGYERDEVDAYLRDVVAETTRLGERVSQLESELASARATASTESTPEQGFKQLGEETTRILVAAESAAREMREKAERQADAELAAAEKAARERVEQASAHADRIVAEAEGRQRDIEAEIRRLEGVRAELVDRLRAAIGTTEQAIGSAPSLDQDAIRPSTQPTQERRSAAFQPTSEVDVEPAPGDVEPVEEPAVEEPAAEEPHAEEPTESAVETTDEEPATDEPAVETTDEPAAETTDEPAVETTEEPAVETTDDTYLDDLDFNDIVLDDLDDEPTAASEEPEEVGSGAARSAVEAALAEADAAAGRTPAPTPAVDADPAMLRERSLAGVRPGMLRRLRRSLQELQNGVLESVRVRTDDNVVEDLLPTDAESGALAEVARVFLDAGYRAGRADAPVMLGGDVLQDPPTDTTLVSDTADALARELLAELRTTLAPSLRAGVEAVEPDASLSERVGEVFRDLKGPVIETVVDRHLTRTYGRATLDGWSESDVTRVQWVLGDETRCPEGVCRANEAEGAVGLGEDFSSGHAVPLAHDGCTCALQPA